MKKFTDNYFRKKYEVLFNRLLDKEGFKDKILKSRKAINIPERGYEDLPDLALAIIDKFFIKNKTPWNRGLNVY